MHSAQVASRTSVRRHRNRVLAAVLLVGSTACNPDQPQVQPPVDLSQQQPYALNADTACIRIVVQAKSPEFADSLPKARMCAYTQDSTRREKAQAVAAAELERHGRMFSNIPEFHDEQRLAGDDATTLGPYTGIFTTPFADRFRLAWQFQEHSPAGVLAGYIVVLQEPGEILPQTYKDLNLHFGMNCIFLITTGISANPLQAKVVQPTGGACRDPVGNRNDVATTLDVRMSNPVPNGWMLGAARFEEDTQGRTVFGLPCGQRWCRIGRPGFAELTTSFCNWGFETCNRKEQLVPGWYDEQQWDEYQGGHWVKRNLRVAIVPRININDHSAASFAARKYMADLYLREAPSPNSRLFLKGVRRGKNKVELERIVDANGQIVWQYIITPEPNTGGVVPQPFVVIHGPHHHWDAPIPGSARFRYTMLDPGIWGPCGQACCPSDGT